MKCSVLLIIFVVSIFLTTVGFGSPVSTGGNVVLVLRPETKIAGDYVKMRDVIEESSVSNDRVNNIVLRKAPRVGPGYKMSKSEIILALRKEYGDLAGIKISGEKNVLVRTKSVMLAKEEYVEQAKLALHFELNNSYEKYEISVHGAYSNVALPLGKVTFEARTKNTRTAKARMVVWVDIVVDGKLYTSKPVWFNTKLYKKVFVAKQRFIRNADVSRDGLNIEVIEVSGISGTNVDVNRQDGLIAKRNIRVGDAISDENTRFAPIISRKQYIKMIVSQGGIGITKRVLSLTDANLGDVITVRGDKSNELYDIVVKSKYEGVPIWCEKKPTPHCL